MADAPGYGRAMVSKEFQLLVKYRPWKLRDQEKTWEQR
jgi:hypothetical protein